MFPQKDYYSLFDYYQWNEKEIEELILSEYDWEKAIDTKSTWHIGDGTASFYKRPVGVGIADVAERQNRKGRKG